MKSLMRVIAATLPIAAAPACDNGVTDVDDFLPTFSNTWHNVADETHTFALASADDGKATGSFSGEENHPDLEIPNPIGGTFTNSVCEFIIDRPGGNVTYAGKFLHADTLRLTRSGETLVIARNQ